MRRLVPVLALLLLSSTTAAVRAASWQVFVGGDDALTPRMTSGVAVDGGGNVFVVDTASSRIHKVSPGGRVLLTMGRLGPTDDGLRRPRGIALDGRGAVFVADTANHRIQRFSERGEPLGPLGTIGSAPGEFILPSSVAFDSQGRLYVADTGNHRIQRLSAEGAFEMEWGGLHFPHGIAVDGQDNVVVADEAGLRRFDPNGQLVAAWTAFGQFGDPYGVFIDAAGTIYVADTDNGRVLELSPDGQLQASWGSEGNEIGQFRYPEAVAVDSEGTLYVADRGNDRIQVLRR